MSPSFGIYIYVSQAFLACNPAQPEDSVCSVAAHDPMARYTDTRIVATPKVTATYLHDPVYLRQERVQLA